MTRMAPLKGLEQMLQEHPQSCSLRLKGLVWGALSKRSVG